jgi:SpoVK/Ycf46/Vps4 family AAA+-type ATPase
MQRYVGIERTVTKLEFEKLFSGASGNNLDGGTFQRMYGTWLTWTQSRKEDVFVVATTNGVERLPAPALRKGRFSEIFFVDLPNATERKTIFDIHLSKRGWGTDEFPLIDVPLLASKTPNRTGSEIEQIVIQGLLNKVKRAGFGKQNPLTTEDLLEAVTSVRTAFELNPQESESIREWAKSHNVLFANKQEEEKTSKSRNTGLGAYKSKKTIEIDEGEI